MSDVVLDQQPIRFPSQRELAAALLNGWFLVLLGVAVGVMWAADNLKASGYQYRAQMQVTQAETTGGGANQLSGLAALAGAGLPIAQNGTEFRLYLDSLKTRDIADQLAKDPTIMHTLFASEWDEATQSWREPAMSKSDANYKAIYDWLGFPSVPWHAPDSESLRRTSDVHRAEPERAGKDRDDRPIWLCLCCRTFRASVGKFYSRVAEAVAGIIGRNFSWRTGRKLSRTAEMGSRISPQEQIRKIGGQAALAPPVT